MSPAQPRKCRSARRVADTHSRPATGRTGAQKAHWSNEVNTTSPLPGGTVVVVIGPEDAGHLAAILRAGLRAGVATVTEDDRALLARLDMSNIRARSADGALEHEARPCEMCKRCAESGHVHGLRPILSARDVAKQAGCTAKTVRMAAAEGNLRGLKVDNAWKFELLEVDRWLALRRR